MLIIKSGSILFNSFESDSTSNTSYFKLFFSTVLKMSSDIFFDRYFLDEIINKLDLNESSYSYDGIRLPLAIVGMPNDGK